MSTFNEPLREHTTSIGFSLTLSKRQIQLLVLLDYAGYQGSRPYQQPQFISTYRSLKRRGLAGDRPDQDGVNDAGRIVCALLREAGIYQDALTGMGIVTGEAVAS